MMRRAGLVRAGPAQQHSEREGRMEPNRPPLTISVDFAAVRDSAERVRGMLLDMRARFDLSPFEYTRQVRIAPTEIPHSHPVLTLNTWVRDDLGLLLMYVHEQMHWYVTWWSSPTRRNGKS
jgi:hypothetical protein